MKTQVLALAMFALLACEAKEANNAALPSQAEAPEQAGSQPPQAAAGAVFPEAFRGRWDKDAAACSNGESTQIVVVRETEIQFFESMAKITSITEDGPNAVRFNGAFSGEGEEWDGTMRLEMSAAGDTLKVNDGATGPLVRCPANGPKPN